MSRRDAEVLLSDERVSVDTMPAEKGLMGSSDVSELTGILGKSSLCYLTSRRQKTV